MSVIKVESIKNVKVYPRVFYRKKGTTAFIYKRNDDEVLKVFRDTFRKRILFETRDMLSELERLSEIKLDSFVTPNDIYVDSKLNVLGYTMDNIKGTRTDRINSLVEIKSLLEYVKKLDEDNKVLSDSKFKLLDLHEKNMYFTNEGYKIFDLDGGYFSIEETKEKIYHQNNKQIKQVIMKGLLGIESNHDIYIRDNDLWVSYCNDNVCDMIQCINDRLNMDNCSINDIKKLTKGFVEVYDAYNPIRTYF